MKVYNSESDIPIAVNLSTHPETESTVLNPRHSRKRVLYISMLAILIASIISVIAYLLMQFISLINNIMFYGNFSFIELGPSGNHLGLWVILMPVIGGVIVGLMVKYGTKGIQGHGIPEAMEQILTNHSKMDPIITYLKPIASAFAIGSGGPFGAEGPIISTGGALGSVLGQATKITDNERKILLAAGASAGMAAIFGSPIAAIFLAVELLLFEFSPRSLVPVALACVTGAAGHKIFFGSAPFFQMTSLEPYTNKALFIYSILGIAIGLISVGVSKFVYFAEDTFNKIPINFIWYPAIGGLVVGIIGYFSPQTLGVGYENITNLLTGNLAINTIIGLSILKFLSWSIALGSGTAGGTLAPLFIIGGATGSLIGMLLQHLFPDASISIHMCALLGMAAMFTGSSRAVLTSIIFAVETTGQAGALLPLLAACFGAYLISFVLMKETIMTEKIARRGVSVPDSYEYDALAQERVGDYVQSDGILLSEDETVSEAQEWLLEHPEYKSNYFVVTSEQGDYRGIISSSGLFSHNHPPDTLLKNLVKRKNIFVLSSDNLRSAVKLMAMEDVDVLPVVQLQNGVNNVIGVLNFQDVLNGFKTEMEGNTQTEPEFNLMKRVRVLRRGKKLSGK